MSIQIKAPVLPESIADATIAKWHKKVGDTVKRDENLVDVETDKVMLEVAAPADGVLEEITQPEGSTVKAQQVIGLLREGSIEQAATKNGTITKKEETVSSNNDLSPAVRRLASEHNVDVTKIKGSGKDGRIVKEDIEKQLTIDRQSETRTQTTTAPIPTGDRPERRVPMTRLRARIAERLLGAQHNMALLTTFNEINMQAVMNLRQQYKDQFEKAHNIRLGFMSFFIKAAVTALKKFPDVNAFIDGNDIIYHGYYDLGVAVSTERGLVVPIIRDADTLSMAEIEAKIAEFARKARDNKLTMEEMQGGTFSITNGGVFGSLLATPIVNPPQSAILGMHKIEDRPIAENGQVVIRPMMYVALTYDHRIIDGRDSVGFLKTIKELLEDPSRLLLDV
jgi:2-oxoglutarate dehydrogenase E2 component (dihydrolipoamide succinyltransferase)